METKKDKYGLESHDRRFGTEEKCRQYIIDHKWKGVPTCEHCKNQYMNYFITTRNIWKCSACKKQFRLTTNTIFMSSNLKLRIWFRAIYFFVTNKRGLSSCQLAKLLEVEQRTAWFMLHRLRKVITDDDNTILNGIVEVDEKYISPDIRRDTRLQRKKKKHEEAQEAIHGLSQRKRRRLRGYPLESGGQKGPRRKSSEIPKKVPYYQPKILLGMAERKGKVIIEVLGKGEKHRTKKNIFPILRRHIDSTSFIYTDEANLYDGIESDFSGRESVNHKEKEFVRGDVHTNTVDGIWGHWERFVFGTIFHMDIHHLKRYAKEHQFR
ncbi:IS1595 family transposase [Fluviicola sp.]|uniref:IS1595 family transposase n=1 Tax=Fluviicola sp. TaxID=1917219 RepID=UPI00262A826E|nr:IS1595 family transposase [Fluviicola sp.]